MEKTGANDFKKKVITLLEAEQEKRRGKKNEDVISAEKVERHFFFPFLRSCQHERKKKSGNRGPEEQKLLDKEKNARTLPPPSGDKLPPRNASMASPDRPGRGIRRQPPPEVRLFGAIVMHLNMEGKEIKGRKKTLISLSPSNLVIINSSFPSAKTHTAGITVLPVFRARADAADALCPHGICGDGARRNRGSGGSGRDQC